MMSWKTLLDRWGSAAAGSAFVLPSLVVEVEPGFVLAARIDRLGRSERRVGRVTARQLEAGALMPHPSQPNLSGAANPEALTRTLREVLEAVGPGNGCLGLLLPDPAVRVGLLTFETLPKRRQEADALVRWRMKELVPFAPEETRLTYQVLRQEPDGIDLVAVAARQSVLAEYEAAVDHLNGEPALLLPATAALLPLLPDEGGTGRLLVHLSTGWVTTVVVAAGRARAWRTRDLRAAEPRDVVEEVGREVARVTASTRDHLELQIERVHLCARPPVGQDIVAELGRAAAAEVELLVPDGALAAGLSGAEAALFESFGATVAGVVGNAKS